MEFDHFDYYSPMELFRITLAAFIPLHLSDPPPHPPTIAPSTLIPPLHNQFYSFASPHVHPLAIHPHNSTSLPPHRLRSPARIAV